MSQMDLFLPLLTTGDIRKRLDLGNDVINYLEDASNDIDCEDIGSFVSSVLPWISQSNFRVSQNGLDIVTLLVARMGAEFWPYINSVVPLAVDRLGDARDSVREKGHLLFIRLMSCTIAPRQLWEKLAPSLAHKRFKVREELLILLQNTLTDHGAGAIHLMPLLPSVVKLLGDSSAPVREAALNTMVDIYRHVGERFRQDLAKKLSVPQERLPALLSAFDRARDAGELKPSAAARDTVDSRPVLCRDIGDLRPVAVSEAGDMKPAQTTADGSQRDVQDDVDRQVLGQTSAARTSATPARPALSRKSNSTLGSTNGAAAGTDLPLRRTHSLAARQPSSSSLTGAAAGAIDETMFMAAFEQVPRLQIFSARDLEDNMLKIREVVSKPSNAWDDRVEALKKLRGVLVAAGTNFDELYQHLRLMEPALQLTLQDLRSQVVREGCITVAYLAQQLGHRSDHVCLALLPYLIELIPNSAKVMSTSGTVTIRFIIQHAPSARLIPVITGQMTAKSREIRRSCSEFLEQAVTTWATSILERHVANVQEALRRGVSDADSEVRSTCRRTYWGFAAHFPQQADSLLNSLDVQHQRSLAGERAGGLTVPTSVRSQAALGATSRGSSRAGSRESLHRTGSLSRRSGAALAAQIRADRAETPSRDAITPRSTSAIDLQAAQRARARAQYAAAQRARVSAAAAGGGQTPGSGASLPRVRRISSSSGGPMSPSVNHAASPYRTPRNRGRQVSQSQPGSRSVSPSSRLSYATYATAAPTDIPLELRGRRSGIPRSTGTSRESSPHRRAVALRARTPSGAGGGGGGGVASRILQHSREAETALADALATERQRAGRYQDGVSDESETSSVCSERSLEVRREQRFGPTKARRIPALSIAGSYRETSSTPRDIPTIMYQIGSVEWSVRKEGLQQLSSVLRSPRTLTASELRAVTDTFTRMFMDQQTKAFGVFLETVQDLVTCYAADLTDWLYVLLTRLLNKLGANLLGSVVQKVEQTLEVIRTSFRPDEQLQCLCRLVTDPTQTPSPRVKVATLHHLHALLDTMEPSAFIIDQILPLAVAKILSWTTDQKSVETRNGAKAVIGALFYLNTAQFTRLQSQLSRLHQDASSDIIQAHLRRRTGVETLSSQQSLSPRSPASPRSPLNGALSPSPSPRSPRPGSAEPDQPDRPVRRAALELQSLRLDGTSSSQDSGLGRVSVERRLGSPISRAGAESPLADEAGMMAAAVEGMKGEDPRPALGTLCKLARHGSEKLWEESIGTVLPSLLDSISCGSSVVREMALSAVADLARRPDGAPLLLPSIDGVFARVLEAHRERAPTEREVVRVAEQCAAVLAGRLPVESVTSALLPPIETGPFPENQAAVKALTRLVEQKTKEEVMPMLHSLMPSLLKAYDNGESLVRKAAVFCMVAIHTQCGEQALQPHLVALSAAKLKLLSVYIKRAPPMTRPAAPK